jgi:3-oxoacyl-[acyl-carrier protein] reductase
MHPAAGFSAYAASKAPSLVLVPIKAAELAPCGITANGIGPGRPGFFDHWSPDAKAALAAASPFGRLGTARDTAGVAGLLASDDARWLCGQVLVANGAASI